MAIKLNNTSLKEILTKNDTVIVLDKGISNEDIVIKQTLIKSSIKIKDSKFKKSLSFYKCKFDGDVEIISTNIDASISFLDCDISGELKFFQPNISNTIDISNSNIKKGIILENIKQVQNLKFISSSSKNFEVLGDLSNNITNITIQNSNIDIAIKIQKIEHLKKFEITNTFTPVLVYKFINKASKNSLNLSINDSIIEEFSIEKSLFTKSSTINILQSKFDNFNIQNNSFIDSKINLIECLISGLLVLDGIKEKNTIFDISTSTILNLKLGTNFIEFISNNTKRAILLSSTDTSQRLKTLIILKNYFASEHLYYAEDKCFYMLKNEEYKYLMEKKSFLQKLLLFIAYFFNRYVFGWGVKIKNPVISSFIAILLFTIFFYFKLNLYKPYIYLEYLNNNISGFYGAGTISAVSFLGQYSDVKFPSNINSFIFISEYILGMILTTVIVGIIIRKLVR